MDSQTRQLLVNRRSNVHAPHPDHIAVLHPDRPTLAHHLRRHSSELLDDLRQRAYMRSGS